MSDEHQPDDFHVDRRVPTYVEHRSAMEKHIQTVLGVLATGLIAWVGISTTDSRESIARLEVQTAVLQARVAEIRSDLKQSMSRGMTKEEINERFGVCQRRVTELEHRMLEVEKQSHFERNDIP